MLSLLITRLLLITSFHAVHISYGDITIAHDSLKGNLTFFKDDWGRATERWYGKSITSEPIGVQEQMECEYLKAHVRFWIDGFRSPISISPRVKSEEGQSVTYEFTTTVPAGSHSIIIDSRAIVTEYSDQMNLLTVTTGNASKNLVLTNDNSFATIQF